MPKMRKTVKRVIQTIPANHEEPPKKRRNPITSGDTTERRTEPDDKEESSEIETTREYEFIRNRLRDEKEIIEAQELYHSMERLEHRIEALKKARGGIPQTRYLSEEARNRLEEEYRQRLGYLRSELRTFMVQGEVTLFKRKHEPSGTPLDVQPEKAHPLLYLVLNKLSDYKGWNYFVPTVALLIIGLIPNAIFGTLFVEGAPTGFLESGTLFALIVLIPAFALCDYIFSKYRRSFETLREVANVSGQSYREFMKERKRRLESNRVFLFSLPILIVAFAIWTYSVVENPSPTNVASYLDDKFAAAIVESVYSSIWVIIFSIAVMISKHVISITIIMREFCDLPLLLRPLHPDGAGGLKPLADLSLVLSMAPLLAFIVIGFYVLGIHYPVGWRILGSAGLVAIIMVIVFFFPLSRAHAKMADAKTGILASLSRRHGIAYTTLYREMEAPDPKPMKRTYEELQKIENLYERAESMPVWPFDVSIVLKLATSIIIPIIVIFGGELILRATGW
jgi:hypothetical protein